jgi:hypothetical protein
MKSIAHFLIIKGMIAAVLVSLVGCSLESGGTRVFKEGKDVFPSPDEPKPDSGD